MAISRPGALIKRHCRKRYMVLKLKFFGNNFTIPSIKIGITSRRKYDFIYYLDFVTGNAKLFSNFY